MRNCDDCKLCCQGYLQGTTRGSWFGGMNPCVYLQEGCIIYPDRPTQCRNYYCAWVQGLLPEEMRPDKINMIVSVENDSDGRQYLKCVSPYEIDTSEVEKFCVENNTYFKTVRVIPIRKE